MWFKVKRTKPGREKLFGGLICSVDGFVLEEYPVVSSAYSLKSMRYPSNIRKRSGPWMEPYGTSTPCFTNLQADHLFFVYIQLD